MLILIARMTPALSYLIPLFLCSSSSASTTRLTALVITHLVITVPIIVYIMIGYFESCRSELEEAAPIDGASVWTDASATSRCRWRGPASSSAPSSRSSSPGTTSSSRRVLGGKNTRTLPAAVYNVLTFEQLAWGPLAAAAIIVTLPVLLLTVRRAARDRRRACRPAG